MLDNRKGSNLGRRLLNKVLTMIQKRYFPWKNSTMDSLICDLHFNLAKHWLIDINGLSGLEIDFYSETQTFFLCVDFCYHRTMIVFAVILDSSFIYKRALHGHENILCTDTNNIVLIFISYILICAPAKFNFNTPNSYKHFFRPCDDW